MAQYSVYIGSVVAFVLSGCTAIPLDQLDKASQAASGSPSQCKLSQLLVDLDPNYSEPSPPPPGGPDVDRPAGENRDFSYVVPAGRELRLPAGMPAPGAPPPPTSAQGFQAFQDALQARLDNSDLTSKVKSHPVTVAIFRILAKSFAQGQINYAASHGYKNVAAEQSALDSYSTSDIKMGDLKDFAKVVHNGMSHPQIVAPSAAVVAKMPPPGGAPLSVAGQPASSTQNTFARYFVDYYEGNFYDRLGNQVSKPTLSLQVPDSDISSSLAVMIEYLVDLIDPTPVLGDQAPDKNGQLPKNTNFYPSQKTSTNEPEALKAGLANYKNISGNVCGVTTTNAIVLYDAANSAGDAASSVSGLVSQSWGGVGVSLGGFLKFSVGDNQTLATMVKTAASRLASRAALASAYWTLNSLGTSKLPAPGAPPLVVPGAAPYLKFGS